MNVSLPLEGHNVAYQCKGLDQSNNLSTNKKVITEKQSFNTSLKRSFTSRLGQNQTFLSMVG